MHVVWAAEPGEFLQSVSKPNSIYIYAYVYNMYVCYMYLHIYILYVYDTLIHASADSHWFWYGQPDQSPSKDG